MTTTYVLATVETRNFSFTALGKDHQQCNVALENAWAKHARQTGADPAMMREIIADGEVNYGDVGVGDVLRDGEMFLRWGGPRYTRPTR